MIRLDKFLANQGFGTRKEVKKLIRKGAVKVDGIIQWKDDYKFDENTNVVSLYDEPVLYKEHTYIMLNKKPGYICANQDGLHATIFDLLPLRFQKMSTVGRLDLDTSGLLLITDDGILLHRLLSPNYHVWKNYEVSLEKNIDAEAISALCNGIDLGDFTTLPAKVDIVDEKKIHLSIREGKFHQVKRMLQAVNNEVIQLKRISFGPLELGDLDEGDWRELSDREIALLKEACRS